MCIWYSKQCSHGSTVLPVKSEEKIDRFVVLNYCTLIYRLSCEYCVFIYEKPLLPSSLHSPLLPPLPSPSPSPSPLSSSLSDVHFGSWNLWFQRRTFKKLGKWFPYPHAWWWHCVLLCTTLVLQGSVYTCDIFTWLTNKITHACL